jgi:hypothetical protein
MKNDVIKTRAEDPVIEGLRIQYQATMDMLALAVEHCPDGYWNRVFGDRSAFWKETYHMLHYLVKYAHGTEGCVYTPFGEQLDPSLLVPPSHTLSRDTILSYIAQTHDHLNRLFNELTPEQLVAPDTYAPKQFGTVINRLLYGLRHGQHHVGKLTGYLFSHGIDYDPWR